MTSESSATSMNGVRFWYDYVRKHLRLLKRFGYLSYKRSLEYRVSLWFNIVNSIIAMAVWFVFWQVIIGQVGTFSGWSLPMMALLLGFFLFQDGIWILFWRHWNFEEDIISGYITVFLVKPINPFLALIWKYMDVMRFVEFLIGLGIILITLITTDLSTTMLRFTLGLFMSTLATFMMMNVFALTNVWTFWIGKTRSLRFIINAVFTIEKSPLNVYPTPVVWFYTLVTPAIFMATYPVLTLLEFSPLRIVGLLVLQIVVAVFWYSVFAFIWKRGMRRFEAYGG